MARFSTQIQAVGRGLLLGIPAFLGLLPFVGIAALLASGLHPTGLPPQVAIIDVPPWAAAYSIAIWPATWAIAKELTYLGYALPRLEQRLGSTWFAATVVVVAWSPQHLVIPILLDPGFALARVITALPVVAGQTLLFFVFRRRLVPLIVAHWAGDALTATLGVQT